MQTFEELRAQIQQKRKELQELTEKELRSFEQSLQSLVQGSLKQIERAAQEEARRTEQVLKRELIRLQEYVVKWNQALVSSQSKQTASLKGESTSPNCNKLENLVLRKNLLSESAEGLEMEVVELFIKALYGNGDEMEKVLSRISDARERDKWRKRIRRLSIKTRKLLLELSELLRKGA